MAHTIKALAISIGAALALTSLPSHAEITLLKQDPQAGDPLSRLILPSAAVSGRSST